MNDLTPKMFSAGIYETADEARLGGLPEHEHDVDTAGTWTLHIDAGEAWYETTVLLDAMMAADADDGAVLGYVGGDSFRQWCEPSTSADDIAVHVYLRAVNGWAAARAARLVMFGLAAGLGYSVTTAGDWAEQLDLGFYTPRMARS